MFRRLGTLGASILVLTGQGLAAQERDATQEYPTTVELEALMDSLGPIRESALMAVEARTAREEEAQRAYAASIANVDTFHVGQLTIITPVDQTERARPVFEAVWNRHFSDLGHSPALEDALFVFQWADDRVPIHTENSRNSLDFYRWVRREIVERDVRNSIAAAMTFDLGPVGSQIGRWTSGNPLRERDMADVYTQVVTTPSIVTRGCLSGDTRACSSALGLDLDPLPGSRAEPWAPDDQSELRYWIRFGPEQLRAWYTPEERQSLIGSIQGLRSRESGRRDACLTDDYDACDALLIEYFGNLVPLGGSVRESLLAYAIEVGGPKAWERVIADPTMTPEEVLEHTAGKPLDDIVSGWQEQLLEARPVSYGSMLPRGALALLWTFLFSALAMRSTRWRLR